MIRHIVAFRLTAEDAAQRDADAQTARTALLGLEGRVPGLRSIQVERDLGLVAGHWDLVLVSEHDDNTALEGYQAHPLHKEASAVVASVVTDRAVVDYEVAE